MTLEERMTWFEEVDAIHLEIARGPLEHVALLQGVLRAYLWPLWDM